MLKNPRLCLLVGIFQQFPWAPCDADCWVGAFYGICRSTEPCLFLPMWPGDGCKLLVTADSGDELMQGVCGASCALNPHREPAG